MSITRRFRKSENTAGEESTRALRQFARWKLGHRKLFTVGGRLGATFAIVLGVVLEQWRWGVGLVHFGYDAQFALRDLSRPDDVVLVYLDDVSYANLNQDPADRWDRSIHAKLVDRMTRAGAKAVVFDIIFDVADDGSADGRERDRLFAESIARNGKVVLAGEIAFGLDIDQVIMPCELFLTNSAGWGASQFFPDEDSKIRKHIWFIGDNQLGRYPSLAWKTAESLGAVLPDESTAEVGRQWINYYTGPLDLPSISYYRVLDEEGAPDEFFRDKIVMIGGRQNTGLMNAGKDTFGTVFSAFAGSKQVGDDEELEPVLSPGTEIHATCILNLLRRDWITRLPNRLELFLVVVVGLIAGLGLSAFKPLGSLIGAVLGLVVVVGGDWWLFRHQQMWFAWPIPAIQVFVAWCWAQGVNAVRSHLESEILEHTLGFHMPRSRARQWRLHANLLKPYGEKMEVSFLFTDIAGFTTIADRTAPPELFENLNRYFEEMVPCIHATDGTVLKFIGDAIFAIWNAPEPQADHAARALRAALHMRDRLEKLVASNQQSAFATRIGVHMGNAYVGNCGSRERFEYTAIGNDVNIASRLEGLNKYFGTSIIASVDLLARTNDEFVVRPLGDIRPKGSDRVIGVAEILAARVDLPVMPDWVGPFVDGIREFQKSNWDAAVECFHRTLALNPGDQAAEYYLTTIKQYRIRPDNPEWAGEIEMDEK